MYEEIRKTINEGREEGRKERDKEKRKQYQNGNNRTVT